MWVCARLLPPISNIALQKDRCRSLLVRSSLKSSRSYVESLRSQVSSPRNCEQVIRTVGFRNEPNESSQAYCRR